MAESATTKKPAAKKAPSITEASTKAAPKASKKEYGYAVIVTGGKQYLVRPGQTLKIEKIIGDHKEGDTITFDQVLMAHDGKDDMNLGAPTVSGMKVTAKLVKIGRHKTIDVIKYKQKSRYFKKNGHRQPYFEVAIDSIQ